MKTLLKVYGVLFLALSAVALTNADKKLLDDNAEKVGELRTLKNLWDAM